MSTSLIIKDFTSDNRKDYNSNGYVVFSDVGTCENIGACDSCVFNSNYSISCRVVRATLFEKYLASCGGVAAKTLLKQQIGTTSYEKLLQEIAHYTTIESFETDLILSTPQKTSAILELKRDEMDIPKIITSCTYHNKGFWNTVADDIKYKKGI